jgi:hypothetical protein
VFGVGEGALDHFGGSGQGRRGDTGDTLQPLSDLQKRLERFLRAQRVIKVWWVLRKDAADDLRLYVWIGRTEDFLEPRAGGPLDLLRVDVEVAEQRVKLPVRALAEVAEVSVVRHADVLVDELNDLGAGHSVHGKVPLVLPQ